MTIPNPRTLDSLDGRIILALDKDPEASALALSRTLGVARARGTLASPAASARTPRPGSWVRPMWSSWPGPA
ncbi:hypothetical protein QFZ69_003247 [Arthrobacter sp. V1I7]|nr:hypothetical protein [Arthrobacter sp. V1I7]